MGLLEPERLGQSGGLLAEEEQAPVPNGWIGIASGALGGGQPDVFRLLGAEELIQVVPHVKVHQVPVVQPRPLHRFFTDVKAQRLDQMEPCPRGGAGPGDVAGILRDLRLYQDDIEQTTTSKPDL